MCLSLSIRRNRADDINSGAAMRAVTDHFEDLDFRCRGVACGGRSVGSRGLVEKSLLSFVVFRRIARIRVWGAPAEPQSRSHSWMRAC